jgi:hypothetical protein
MKIIRQEMKIIRQEIEIIRQEIEIIRQEMKIIRQGIKNIWQEMKIHLCGTGVRQNSPFFDIINRISKINRLCKF